MTFALQHDPALIYYLCVIELGKSAESGKQSTSVHSLKKTCLANPVKLSN